MQGSRGLMRKYFQAFCQKYQRYLNDTSRSVQDCVRSMFKRRSESEVVNPFAIMVMLIFRYSDDGALPLERRSSSWVIDPKAFYRYLCPEFMAKLQLFLWIAILGDKHDQRLVKLLCNEELGKENWPKAPHKRVKFNTLFKKFEGYTDVLVDCWKEDLKFFSTVSHRVQDIFVCFMMTMSTTDHL